MAFTAKILSWRFRHLNIVGCLLKRRPTKGGHGHPRTPLATPLPLWWPTTVTAKPKTSRQNQMLHSKNKIAVVLPWVFAFAVRYLAFAVKYLVSPWGLWFCREGFGFVVRYFVFTVRFLVLPWGFWFCREVFCFCREVFVFAVTAVGHRKHLVCLPMIHT